MCVVYNEVFSKSIDIFKLICLLKLFWPGFVEWYITGKLQVILINVVSFQRGHQMLPLYLLMNMTVRVYYIDIGTTTHYFPFWRVWSFIFSALIAFVNFASYYYLFHPHVLVCHQIYLEGMQGPRDWGCSSIIIIKLVQSSFEVKKNFVCHAQPISCSTGRNKFTRVLCMYKWLVTYWGKFSKVCFYWYQSRKCSISLLPVEVDHLVHGSQASQLIST